MALIYQLRGDTLSAYYSTGNGKVSPITTSGGNAPVVTATSGSGIFGSSIIKFNSFGFLSADASLNWPANGTWSIVARILPYTTGNLNLSFVNIGATQIDNLGARISVQNGDIVVVPYGALGSLGTKFLSNKAFTTTSGTPFDLCLTWDGSGNSNSIKCSRDGVDVGSMTPNNSATTSQAPAQMTGNFSFNIVGGGPAASTWGLIEFSVFDNVIDHEFGTRSDYWSATAFDGTESTDPGVANVLSATGYTINGVSLTGTYNPPASTNPGAANVLSGTSYIINDSTFTGTLANPTYTDPGTGNVRNGTSYIFNDTTQTGSLIAPQVGSGAAGTVDLNNIKEQIQTILETNNTTTSSILDLSTNLSNSQRVEGIFKINPLRLFHSMYEVPAVTTWVDNKGVTLQGSIKDQSSAKKEAVVNFKVAGIVNNANINTVDVDEADEDLQYLMENIEKILRHYDTLNDSCRWAITRGVTYEDVPISEDAIYRVGILDLEVSVKY